MGRLCHNQEIVRGVTPVDAERGFKMSSGFAGIARHSLVNRRVLTGTVACVAAVIMLVWPAGVGAYTTTDVSTAVANGVAYIDTQQNADGSFGVSYPVAETGFAIVTYGVLDGGDYTKLNATYQAHLKSAVSWLLTQQDATSGAFGPGSGVDTYSTGIALEALSLSTGVDPGVPAAISKARSYLISSQNAPPAVTGNLSSPDCTGADGSGTEGYCGGWNYEQSFGRSDESNTGFALTGLALTGGVPAASAAVDVEWQRHVQQLRATNPLATANDGAGCYEPGYFCNANDTGSLVFGYGYDGLPAGDVKVAAAILIAQDTIDEYELMKASVRSSIGHTGEERDGTCVMPCTWTVHFDGGYHYSIWAITKGLGQYIPADFQLTDPTNWYDKVVDLLLSEQGTDGSWPQDGRDDGSIIGATSFGVSALKLVGARPDLSVTKTDSPDPVSAGNTLTYSLSVQNGGGDATGVTLTDTLPAGVTFVSATPSQGSCTQAAGTVICNLGTLANAASATVEIKVTPQSGGMITNSASATSNEPDSNITNNSASATTTVTSTSTGQLEVRKVLAPMLDPGRFNLQIDSATVKADASNGDTTGKQTVSAGPHLVGETAGTATLPSGYTSTISCKDQGGTGSEIASATNAGPLSVNVAANADVVCTITNTREQATPPSCEVEGEGTIKAANGDKAGFRVDVDSGSRPEGTLRYRDRGPAQPFRLKSTQITDVTISADLHEASITGKGTINGTGSVDFQVDVKDPAGKPDTFRIRLSNGYDSGEQKIRGGDADVECGKDDDDHDHNTSR
jgi:uncharacterized repeat protein (TIGR01451 family)